MSLFPFLYNENQYPFIATEDSEQDKDLTEWWKSIQPGGLP